MIPGLAHGLIGGDRIIELELVGVGVSSGSSAVNYSHTPQSGDLAILTDMSVNRVSRDDDGPIVPPPAAVVPSGFTQMVSVGVTKNAGFFDYGARTMITVRRCDGTESSSITGMAAGSWETRKAVTLFRPSPKANFDFGASGSATAVQTSGTNTLPVSLAGRSVAPVLHVVCYCYANNTAYSIVGTPSLASLDNGVNRFRTSWAFQQFPEDLAAQSAALSASRSDHLIGAIAGLVLT
jgi:hypothetical protein